MFNHRRHALPIFVLAAFSSFHLAINIYIPSLPSVAEAFQANQDIVQISVGSFLIASGFSNLIYGILSDQVGRKPILLIGMILFLLSTLLCMVAPSLEALIILRACQGLGAGAISVTCFSMIQEHYPIKRATELTSIMGIFREFVVALAPILGGYLVVIGGWRSTFLLIALVIVGALYYARRFLPETSSPAQKDQKISFKPVLKNYKSVLSNPQFIRFSIIFPLLLCGLWSYLTVLPFYFITTLGIPIYLFGFYIAPAAIMYSLGSVIVPRLIHRYDLNTTIKIGLIICFLAGIGQLGAHFFIPGKAILIVLIQAFFSMGMALVFAPSISKAVEPFQQNRATANSLGGMMRQSFAGLGALAGGYFDDSNMLSVAVFLIGLTFIAMLIFFLLEADETKQEKTV